MASRVCPQCGSQYVASVRRCIDCDVTLIDDASEAGEATPGTSATPVGAGDEVAYELDGWSNQLKVTLEGMLDRAGIRRVWEAAVLVVPADAEDEVDALIATVEGVELDELIDEGVQVAFELHELSADELEDLDAQLYGAGVAHAWTEAVELLVAEDAADAVEAMIDAIVNPEDDEGDQGDDGFATPEALSALFVAVDKLVKDPLEERPVARFLDASAGVAGLGVPYGLAGDDWASFLALVDELRAVVLSDVDDALDDIDDEHVRLDDDGMPLDEVDLATVDHLGDEAEPAVVDRYGLARDLALELRARLRDLV